MSFEILFTSLEIPYQLKSKLHLQVLRECVCHFYFYAVYKSINIDFTTCRFQIMYLFDRIRHSIPEDTVSYHLGHIHNVQSYHFLVYRILHILLRSNCHHILLCKCIVVICFLLMLSGCTNTMADI